MLIVVAPLAIVALYCVMTFMLGYGFNNAVNTPSRLATNKLAQSVSIIVAFRNEAQNISRLLDSLSGQEQCEAEIILVNDHSDDESLEVIAHWQQVHSDVTNVRVLESSGTGKKDALTSGVAAANNAIILTTDADCQVDKHWAASMSRSFDDEVQFVFGAVRINDESTLYSAMQQMEFASLVGSGAAMHQLGADLFCNGANLGYRKDAFRAVNGYAGNNQIASGDDEFLMRKINVRYAHAVKFNAEPQSIVSTRPQTSFGRFVQQRIRWAGKWKQQSALSIAVAIFIFMVNGSTLFLAVCLFTAWWPWALAMVSIKMASEFVFLYSVYQFLKMPWRPGIFFLLSTVYPVYVLFFSIAANSRSFSWKERPYKNP